MGSGLAVGMAIGIAIGISIGMATGLTDALQKVRASFHDTVDAKQLSIRRPDGSTLAPEHFVDEVLEPVRAGPAYDKRWLVVLLVLGVVVFLGAVIFFLLQSSP